jgi:hypothetical protein
MHRKTGVGDGLPGWPEGIGIARTPDDGRVEQPDQPETDRLGPMLANEGVDISILISTRRVLLYSGCGPCAKDQDVNGQLPVVYPVLPGWK